MESFPNAEREALWQQVKAAHEAIDALRAQEEHEQPGDDVHHQMKIASRIYTLEELAYLARQEGEAQGRLAVS